MSRELWAVESDVLPKSWLHKVDGTLGLVVHRTNLDLSNPDLVDDLLEIIAECRSFIESLEHIDFDAIWRRYNETANRRSEAGLTYDELKQLVLGGTE